MLHADKHYNYSEYPDTLVDEYRISPNDQISFSVFPNNGERLVSGIVDKTNLNNTQLAEESVKYTIEPDGTAKLPLLGNVKLGGLTNLEAEKYLEQMYSTYINEPYVKLTVTNRRVFVYSGDNSATVVVLENRNTTLYEAIAIAGGIGDSRAYDIKLVRKKGDKLDVYNFDLSEINNVSQGNIILQSNDLVYITPRVKISERISQNFVPYLSVMSALLAIFALIK